MSSAEDRAKALLRTAWPYAVGAAAVWVVQVADWVHFPVGEPAAQLAAGYLLGTGVYWLGSALSRAKGTGHIGALARFAGRVLVSAGVNTGSPLYAKNPRTGPWSPFGPV